jgi:hypothetical protein
VRVAGFRGDQVVAEALGQAFGQVADTAEQALRRWAQELAAFQEWQDEMGDLH